MNPTKTFAAASVALALAVPALPSWAGTSTGPSSSASPYVINVPPSVDVISIFTVGDSVNAKPGSTVPYRMVGIPDGMGTYDNHDGTFTLLMNHEIGATVGLAREHGFGGAFVSQWIIRKGDLAVLHGGDVVKKLYEWNAASGGYQPATRAMGRLCSADLPARSAFYNSRTGKGYSGRIFMNGEEVGNEGRAFAHVVTGPGAGISYELPSLGKFSWENSVASPYEQDRTVVIGLDDTTPGQLYVYVGSKQSEGTEIEKAGLHGGSLHGIKVQGVALEDRAAGIPNGTRFSLHDFGDVTNASGAQLQADSVANDVTQFLRPEDGAWDTRDPSVFYFVTTDRFDTTKDGSGGANQGAFAPLSPDFRRHPQPRVRRTHRYDARRHRAAADARQHDCRRRRQRPDAGGPGRPGAPRAHLEVLSEDAQAGGSGETRPGAVRHAATITRPRHPQQRRESSGIIEITHLLGKKPLDRLHDFFDRHDDDDDDSRLRQLVGETRLPLLPGRDAGALRSLCDPELVKDGQLFLLAVPKNLQ